MKSQRFETQTPAEVHPAQLPLNRNAVAANTECTHASRIGRWIGVAATAFGCSLAPVSTHALELLGDKCEFTAEELADPDKVLTLTWRVIAIARASTCVKTCMERLSFRELESGQKSILRRPLRAYFVAMGCPGMNLLSPGVGLFANSEYWKAMNEALSKVMPLKNIWSSCFM